MLAGLHGVERSTSADLAFEVSVVAIDASVTSLVALAMGSGLTMLGQTLADRRSLKKATSERREDLKLRQYEMERESLMVLQELIVKLSDTTNRFRYTLDDGADVREIRFELSHLRHAIRMHIERCFDGEVRESMKVYLDFKYQELKSTTDSYPQDRRASGRAFRVAQEAIGSALRRGLVNL
jgi:hypothetical protein